MTGRPGLALVLLLASCAARTPQPSAGAAAAPQATHPNDRCVHGVPCETCVKCHPELASAFQRSGDWCPEHALPESQCGLCHPEVLRPGPRAPSGADVKHLVIAGEDLPSLSPHLVPGKVTIFDFYADWCGPCRQIDAHVFALLSHRGDLAYRKLNLVSWQSPLARRHLVANKVPGLPYVIVYGKDGRRVRAISGLHLDQLDAAIREATSP